MAHTQTVRAVKHIRGRNGNEAWVERVPTRTSGLHVVRHMSDILIGGLELLLGMRLTLQLFGVGNFSTFTQFVYGITQPLVQPFVGLFPNADFGTMDGGILESATIVSMIVLAFIGYAIQRLLHAMEPRPVMDTYEEEL